MSSVSNGLYFLTLPLVIVIRAIYRKIRHALYLYIKRNVEKVWGARYILGARYLSKNTVDLEGVRDVWWDKWGLVRAGNYILFYGKENENHHLETGFFVHYRIV